MKTTTVIAALCGTAFAGVASAELDFSDFDDFLMQSMETTLKGLEPRIGAKDVGAATAGADEIRDGLQWAESYFASKGGADDAVEIAKEGQRLAAAVTDSLAKGDFESAATAARGIARACRTCHDAYRP